MKIKVSTEIDGYLKADHLKISTTSIEPVDVGEIVWNQIDGTFDMGLVGGVTLQAGQEMHIYGKATEAISNGEAVMFAGVEGDHLLIARADATIINANPEYLIGVSTQSFTTNQFGYVTTLGNVRGLNTLAYTLGTVLYYNSESATDGLLTATEPTAPNAKIEVAAVVRVHGTQGILLVRPHVMPRVKDLQDIYAPSPTQAKGLFWNNTNSRYQNYTVPEILGYTPANDATVVHKTGDESITGHKSFSNVIGNPAITVSNSNNGGNAIVVSNTLSGTGLTSGNFSSGVGISSSNSAGGNGIYSNNSSTGIGIYSINGGSGKNLVLNNTSTGTGMPFTIQKTGVDKLTISDGGYITSSGGATFATLGGVGTRTVVANATGVLSTITTTDGTVTSVSALTLGTTGTDLSSTVANSTTTPIITLNVPTASATNRGALSSTDWNTFNSKLTLPTLTSGSVLFSNGTTIAQDNANFFWDDTNNRLGILTNAPKSSLHVAKNGNIAGGSILLGNETSLTSKYGVVTGTNYDNVLYPTGVNIASSVSIAAENRVNIGGGIDELNSANTINFYTTDASTIGAGTIKMKILSDGKVGIGTDSPFYKTDIVGGADAVSTTMLTLRSNFVSTNTGTTLKFINSTIVNSNIGSEITSFRTNAGGLGSSDLIFRTSLLTAINEVMRITSNGNVGIGTDTINFNSKLEIKGSASPTNSLMVTTNTFTATSAGSVLRIGHESTLGSTSARIENLINGGTAYGNLGLQVGGGSVGVGGTSFSAPGTGGIIPILAVGGLSGAILQLRNTTSLTTSGSNLGVIQFVSSYYGSPYAAANIIAKSIITTSGGASGGAHIIFETSTGLTGEAPTEKIRLLGNGNLGIGITNATEKLHISGNAKAISYKANTGYGDVSFTAYYGGALILPTSTTGSVYIGNTYDTVSLYAGGSGTFKSLAGTGTRNVVADTSGQLIISPTSTPTYKVYTALLTQSGTAAPVAIILENTLGATITWTRQSTGIYWGTASLGVLTTNKTTVTLVNGSVGPYIVGGFSSSTTRIEIASISSSGGSLVDTIIWKAPIEIRVYN